MIRSRTSTLLAAAFLTLTFAWVSYVMLLVEPSMGFETPADFLDPAKVAAGYESTAWLASNLLYLGIPFALVVLVTLAEDQWVVWFGLSAALLFLVIGAIDRVGIQLPSLLDSEDAVVAAVGSFLSVRFALLKAAVLSFGLFAWRIAGVDPARGMGASTWRGLGWLAVILSVVFLFAFVPVPLGFFLWGIGLTATVARRPTS